MKSLVVVFLAGVLNASLDQHPGLLVPRRQSRQGLAQ